MTGIEDDHAALLDVMDYEPGANRGWCLVCDQRIVDSREVPTSPMRHWVHEDAREACERCDQEPVADEASGLCQSCSDANDARVAL
jgi:hypothetical protein